MPTMQVVENVSEIRAHRVSSLMLVKNPDNLFYYFVICDFELNTLNWSTGAKRTPRCHIFIPVSIKLLNARRYYYIASL